MKSLDATSFENERPTRTALGEWTRDLSPIARAKGLFLLAAGISFLVSVSLWFLADREQGLFVGLWVPSILSLGSLLLAGKEQRS